jgi:hypothetical protein
MEILKYSEYNKSYKMAEEFVESFNSMINESNEKKEEYESILKKVVKDLSLNFSFIGTFGTGLSFMCPIIDELIKNSNLKIEMNLKTVVLISITALSIVYLEEKKSKLSSKEAEDLKNDSKSLLTELKLVGVGNGIIKKMTECIKSIGNIFKIIFKRSRQVVSTFFDLFGYTALLLPVINAIYYMIGKYDMNIDTLTTNFLSLGLGVATLTAKHGINYIIDKIKNVVKVDIEKLEEEPIITKLGGEPKTDIINEDK